MFAGPNTLWISADKKSKFVYNPGTGFVEIYAVGTKILELNATKIGAYGTTPATRPTTPSSAASTAITAIATTAATNGTPFGFVASTQPNAIVASLNALITRVDALTTLANALKTNLDTLGWQA